MLSALLGSCILLQPAQPPMPLPGLTPPRVIEPLLPAQPDISSLVQANHAFAFDLLRTVSVGAGDANIALSPHSISIALAMTHAGARGQTAADIARALHFRRPSPALDDAFAALLAKITPRVPPVRHPDDPGPFTLNVANRLWAARELTIQPEYAALLERAYHAVVGSLDFAAPIPSAKVINDWVKEQTRGLIPSIIEPQHITPGGFIITNAVYFKGTWIEQFSRRGTRPEAFHLPGGKTEDVPTMHQQHRFAYAAGEFGQALSMPYYGGAEMTIILPPEGGMDKTLGWLTPTTLGTIDKALQQGYTDVVLSLPRINIKSKASIRKTLEAMKMSTPFTVAADFGGMVSSAQLMIADVLHAVDIRVDENGTEAAAVTAVVAKPTSAAPSRAEPTVVKVDRPFLILIRHSETGEILFLARVNDPRG